MDYPNREAFTREVEVLFARASVAQELITFFEHQDKTIEKIRKQLAEPTKNWTQ